MIKVAHLLRTHGMHGGEHQLFQLLNLNDPNFCQEYFIDVFHDPVCYTFYQKLKHIILKDLWPFMFKPRSWIIDALFILLLWPFLNWRLFKVLHDKQIDICIAHGFPAALTSWPVALCYKKTKFLYMHRGTKSMLGRSRIFKYLYQPFSAFIAVSKASADSMRSLISGKPIYVISNGIDLKKIEEQVIQTTKTESAHKIVLVTTGRLTPQKQQAFLIKAFARFQKNFPNSELWIMGAGEILNQLNALADELQVADKLKFLGYRKDVIALLCEANIFVYASESEGMSNAVLEAMAVGLPSIVVDAPGVSECHVQAETGYIVPRAIDAFVASLSKLASNPNMRNAFSEKAKQHVMESYSMISNRQKFNALYSNVIGV